MLASFLLANRLKVIARKRGRFIFKVEQYFFGSSGRSSKTSNVWENLRKISSQGVKGADSWVEAKRRKMVLVFLFSQIYMPNNKFSPLSEDANSIIYFLDAMIGFFVFLFTFCDKKQNIYTAATSGFYMK